jgi:hypothetical protein
VLDSTSAELDSIKPTTIQTAYTAALNSIPLVVEDECTWAQVWEFRRDPEAKRRYRQLRTWLRDGLAASSVSHAQGLIEQRIEDYCWALKRHGLRSALGTLKAIVKPDNMVAASVATLSAGLVTGTVGAAITAGVALSNQVALEVGTFLLERQDIKRGLGSESALIYEARRRFVPKDS